jgi:two-component system, OmpR family, sensor histidine kinase MtrB
VTHWWGLRARLLAAFAALVVLTGASVAGGMYVQARTEILQKAQDNAVNEVLTTVEGQLPLRTLPPTDQDLQALAGQLSNRTDTGAAAYDNRWSGDLKQETVPQELRAAVAEGYTAWQRVEVSGYPILVTGTRVNGTRLEVYAMRSLLPEEQSISAMAERAWLIAGGALVMAMLIALVAAEGVLGPIRRLGRAATSLGKGDLTTRLEVKGKDELAAVSATFNNTAEALQRHVEELRRMEAEARRFVADVSHELRTPLAAMTAVTDVLDEESTKLTPDAAKAAKLVSQETKNLTSLVNDLIEITRFDSGRAKLMTDELNVAEAIKSTLTSRAWQDKVTVDLPGDITARLDARRLDVIVANLIGNALAHGRPPITVTLSSNEAWITIEVKDKGEGMPPEVLPNVFNRFYKADTARTRGGSSGLGLAIAKENANLHGGELHAGNAPEGGAVFTLHLPKGATK